MKKKVAKYTEKLHFQVTKKQRDKLEKAADFRGTTISQMARFLLDGITLKTLDEFETVKRKSKYEADIPASYEGDQKGYY